VLDTAGEDYALAVGADGSGAATLFAVYGGQTTMERRDASSLQLARTLPPAQQFLVGAGDATYVAVGASSRWPVSLLERTLTRPSVVRYTSRGDPESVLFSCEFEDCGLLLKGVDDAGNLLVRESYLDWSTYRMLGPDGTARWSFEGTDGDHGPLAIFGPAATIDRSGRVLLYARTTSSPLTGPPTWRGAELEPGGHAYVIAVGGDGDVLWTRELPALNGAVSALGASERGTVLALGTHDDEFTFAGTTLRGGVAARFLLAIEADGTPRWARTPEASGALAVHPSGLLAAALECSGGRARVDAWNLAGEHLWTRLLPSACMGGHASIATLANRDVVVGTEFSGVTDYGLGPVTAEGLWGAAFVALAP
jgi:hypothetical protein